MRISSDIKAGKDTIFKKYLNTGYRCFRRYYGDCTEIIFYKFCWATEEILFNSGL